MTIKGLKHHLGLFIINHFFTGTKYFNTKRKLLKFAGIKCGEGTRVAGNLKITANVSFGKNCWIGVGFTAHGNGNVIIGDNCDIAPDVTFLTGGHEIGDENRRAGKGQIYKIVVQNGCWIGARSTILKNTIIGKSSVIGAGSLVNKNIEDNVVAAGVPARIIRRLNDENKK